jgi:PAS domain S-box-containing protein
VAVANATVQSLLIGDAMEGAPAAVFVADDRRRFLAVNRFACELLGYTRDELLALRADELTDNDAFGDRFEELRTTGHVDGSVALRRKDGSLVRVRYTAGETKVSGLNFWVGIGLPE